MTTVFEQLDSEWSRLARSRGAARRLAAVCAVAGGARSLADMVAVRHGEQRAVREYREALLSA